MSSNYTGDVPYSICVRFRPSLARFNLESSWVVRSLLQTLIASDARESVADSSANG
jgi:hypothetical protein